MAGRPSPIEVVDLRHLAGVRGGLDDQTVAGQRVISAAVTAMQDVVRATKPPDLSMFEVMFQLIGRRRSGAGPAPAPALPPTSTMTR